MTERRPESARAGPVHGATGSTPVTGSTAWIERWFLRVALGIGSAAWLALVLAELGRLSLGLLLTVWAVGATALAAYAHFVRPSAAGFPLVPRGSRAVVAFAASTVLAGFLFLPPFETAVNGDDATVYLNFSRKIAETGALVFDDPLVRELPVETREYLFLNRQPRDMTGRYARFPGGFLISDIAEPDVTAGFSPLFPVLAALFHQASPPLGAFFVAPLFGALSIGGLFLVGASCGGLRVGLLAALLTAVSLPQIWFARYPLPETVAQFFLMAGLVAVLAAFRDNRPWLGAGAGWLFGVACFAKIDLLVLLSVALAAFVAWWLLVQPGGRGRCVALLLVAFGAVFLHNLLHYLVFPSHYAPYLEQIVRSQVLELLPQLGMALLALLAAVGAGLVAIRRGGLVAGAGRALGWVLVGLLIAYAAIYVTTYQGRWPDTLFWLSWYLSWPVLGMCVVGLLWLVGSGRAGRADPGLAFLLVLTAVVSLHYLYDPLEPGQHIWSMRRFVPVVLPGLLVVVATGAGRLVEWVYFEFRTVATTALAAMLVGFVGAPSASVLGERLWAGVLDQSTEVARTFPDDSVVLVGPELAGTHIQTSLTYLHGVDAVLVQQDEPGGALLDVVRDWLAAGRPVFVVVADRGFSVPAPELTLAEVRQATIDLRTLERTRERAPSDLVDVAISLRILQVARDDASAGRVIDIGNLADDLVAGLRGFHGPEQDSNAKSFRWSEEEASVAIAGGDRVRLEVAGGRPTGMEPAEISVWAGPHQIANGLAIGDAPQTITLELPESERAGATELTIRSTAFRPVDLGLSSDRRNLGVRVYAVEVLRDPADDPSLDLR